MNRVLFVNQTAQMSGAEHSLLSLISGLPDGVVAGVACPSGDLADVLRDRGVPVWRLEGTDVSFRLTARHTTRGLARIASDATRLPLIARRARADIVHANTARAGLISTLAGVSPRKGTVVHIRDWLPPGRVPELVVGVLRSSASAVLVNSTHLLDELPRSFGRAPVHVVHNPVDLRRFDPDTIDRTEARARLGLSPDDLVVTIVGQITPWKAQDDAVRIVAAARKHHPDLKLVIAGSAKFSHPGTRFDSVGFEHDVRTLVRALALEDVVTFAGERDDVPHVLRAADVHLVPSWQEAFGRVALEAMAMAVPVVATSQGGPAEIVRDGIDGRVLEPRHPIAWSSVVSELLANPAQRRTMGAAGRERAQAVFGIERHAARIMEVYDEIRAA